MTHSNHSNTSSRKGHGRPQRRRVGLRDAVEAFVEGRFQRTHLRSPRPVSQLLLLPPLPRLSLRGAGGLVLPLRKGRVARCGACCCTAARPAAHIAAFRGDKAEQELVVEDELLAALAPVVVEAARRAILLGRPTAGLVRALRRPPGWRRWACMLLWPRHGCWWLSGGDGRHTRRRRRCAPLRLPREGVEHMRPGTLQARPSPGATAIEEGSHS